MYQWFKDDDSTLLYPYYVSLSVGDAVALRVTGAQATTGMYVYTVYELIVCA